MWYVFPRTVCPGAGQPLNVEEQVRYQRRYRATDGDSIVGLHVISRYTAQQNGFAVSNSIR